jgi:NitT/TauT family transport system permease protein
LNIVKNPARVRSLAAGIISLAAFLLLWEAVSYALASPFLPGPYPVLLAFIKISTVGDLNGFTLADHAAASLYRVLLGFVVGSLLAIPLGILMGVRSIARAAATPILEPMRFIPPIAWIPLAMILLSGLTRYIFLIGIGVFFPVLLNTMAGVRRTSITLVNVAKTFGANDRTIIRKIVFPSALPEILTGLRVGMGIGWMCIVAAEMIGGAPVGLGVLILEYSNYAQIDVVIAGMITIGLIGLAINYLMLWIENWILRWRVAVAT